MTDFKLIRERLGLRIQEITTPTSGGILCDSYVRAADLEALLAESPILHVDNDNFGWTGCEKDDGEYFKFATHTALLLGIQPIAKPDTAESLLREFVCLLTTSKAIRGEQIDECIRRSKALLKADGGE